MNATLRRIRHVPRVVTPGHVGRCYATISAATATVRGFVTNGWGRPIFQLAHQTGHNLHPALPPHPAVPVTVALVRPNKAVVTVIGEYAISKEALGLACSHLVCQPVDAIEKEGQLLREQQIIDSPLANNGGLRLEIGDACCWSGQYL